MSPLWPATAFASALLLGMIAAIRRIRAPEDEIVRENYASRPVPVVLGAAIVLSAQTGILLALMLALLAGPVPAWPVPLVVVAGGLVLHLAGYLDDRREGGPRGIGGHLRSLMRMRPTTGIVKLVAGVAAAVAVAVAIGGGPGRIVLAAVVVSLAVNVVNALDVRPGRALKWSLLALIPVVPAAWGDGVVLPLAAYLGAALAAIPFDLRERAMLGDAGSNPLGLVVGTGLAAVLSLPLLVAAAVVLVALQVAAETVTISRLIEAVPPVRWFDRLGRSA